MLDFPLLRLRQIPLEATCADLTPADLYRLTDEMVDTMLSLFADVTDADVTFQPVDPVADDQYAVNPDDTRLAWTLWHVLVHTTASGEETASQAADLARGVAVTWRDVPHLETTYIPLDYPNAKPRNAIQRYVAGLAHDDAHLEQIAEILRQSRQARTELAMI